MSKGCKITLIVLGVLFVLLLVVVILSWVFCEKISTALIEKGIDIAESSILKDLPRGFDSLEVRQEFDALRASFRAGELKNPEKAPKIQVLATGFQSAMTDGKVDGDELTKLINQMRDITGKPPLEPLTQDTLQQTVDSVRIE